MTVRSPACRPTGLQRARHLPPRPVPGVLSFPTEGMTMRTVSILSLAAFLAFAVPPAATLTSSEGTDTVVQGSFEGGALGLLGAGVVALALARWLKRRP